MKINRLRLVNFRQHRRTELAFESGITGIIGPNGSGKTTILEAIAWALYGNQAVRGTRDSIRFTGAAPRSPVEVELDFELAGHHYSVSRGLTSASVTLDGASAPIANSISGTNDLIQQRLGMSRAEFFNTYFTGQKELSVMAAMGPTERGQFLSRVLGYERLRSAQDLIRDRRKLIGAEIVGLRTGMPDADTIARTVAAAESRLAHSIAESNEAGTRHAASIALVERITPVWRAAQTRRDDWHRLQSELALARRDVASLQRELERVAGELGALATVDEELAGLLQATRELPRLRAELSELDELFRQQGRRQALVENERALSEELVRSRERLSRLESAPAMEAAIAQSLDARRRELAEVEALHETRRTDWVRDRQEASTKLQSLRQQYADVKQQRDRVTGLGSAGICPTCSRVLGESFQSVVAQLGEQLETLEVDGAYYRDRGAQLAAPPAEVQQLDGRRRELVDELSQLERKLAKVQLAAQELQALTQDIASKTARCSQLARDIALLADTYDAARHGAVRAEIERLLPLQDRASRLTASAERVPALQNERRRVADDLDSASTKLAALEARGADTSFSEEEFASLRAEFERLSAGTREAEMAVVRAQGEVRAAQQTLDAAHEARVQLERIAEKLTSLNGDRLLHDELDRAFSELRTDLNFQLRPELSELASSFLSDLTDDRYSQLELDDQYNIVILEDKIAKPVISGGEEDLANLVLRLAISQMIAERAGQAFSLLILDEVFGSLDASRRDNVVELLRRLQDRFEQVILITHIESVREGLDRVISVRYDEATGTSIAESPGDEMLIPPVAAELAMGAELV